MMSVSLWTDYQSAGGTRLGSLNPQSGAAITRIDGDDRLTIYVSRAEWLNTPLADIRRVIRIEWPEGLVDEFRIQRVRGNDNAPVVQIDAIPVFAELVASGVVITNTNNTATSRIAGSYKVSQWCSLFALAHQGATRINLVLGTVASDSVVDTEYDSATPGQIIRDVAAKTGQEVEIVRTNSTTWTLNFKIAVGSTAETLIMRSGVNIVDLEQSVDDTDLATTVIPLGDVDSVTGSRATIANVKYRIQSVTGTGPFWVGLFDVTSNRAPIQTDTQWVGMVVVWADGSTSTIIDSRASDSAVQVNSQPGVSIGQFVGLAADTSGTPLTEVFDTTTQAARGRRAVSIKLGGQRGERNELANGRFSSGITNWSALNTISPPAYTEVERSSLGTTITGTASARAAGTSTATPLALTIGANQWVRQQDTIQIGGQIYTISSNALATTGGVITLPISPALVSPLASGATINVTRRITYTMTTKGDQSPIARRWVFNNADFLFKFNSEGSVYAMSGTINSSSITNTPLAALDTFLSGQAWTQVGDPVFSFSNTPAWGSQGSDEYSLTVSSVPNANTVVLSAADVRVQIGTRLANLGTACVRVTALSGDNLTLTVAAEPGSIGNLSTGTVRATNVVIPNGTTFTMVRTVDGPIAYTLNGVHNVGATSLVCNANASYATTNLTSSHSLTIKRYYSLDFKITSFTSAVDSGDGYWVVTYAVDTAYGTAPLWEAPDAGVAVAFYTMGGTYLQSAGTIQSYSAGVVVLRIVPPDSWFDTGLPYRLQGYVELLDSYPISSATAWDASGQCTLTLGTAIKTNRSHPKYANVGLNIAPLDYSARVMLLASAVSSGATSIPIVALSKTAPHFPWRVPSSSLIPTTGNTMYAAQSAQANGSGAVSVPITAANTNAIGAGEVVTITRPSLLRPSDPVSGSVVRMLYSIGGTNIPATGSYGLKSETFTVTVPSGQTRTVTAYVTFALSTGTYNLGNQPAISIVNNANNGILGYARTSDANVQVVGSVTWVRLVCQVVLSATTTVFVGCYGGGSASPSLWTAVIDAMLAVTDKTDVPYVDDSWANLLAMRGIDYHASRRIPVPNIRCEWKELRSWCDAPPTSAPVVLGQTVNYPSLGVTRRVVQIERSLILPEKITVEVGTVPTELSRRVANLIANS